MAERPTPHAVALCTLIALHSDPSFDLFGGSNEERKERDKKLWELIQHRVVLGEGVDPSIKDLLLQVQAGAGQRSCDLLLEYVGMSASSVDALVDLMESLRSSVSEGIVDGNSSYGIYLRQMCLGFDELSFEAMTRLWESLRDSVETLKQDKLEDPPSSSSNDGIEESRKDAASLWPPSCQQIENSLRRLCLEMDMGSQASYEDIEMKVQGILKRDPELPTAHFLRFINCLHNNERVGAIDALHQYFDYAMIQDRKQAKGAPRQNILQYAAVLLAALHSSFGDRDLSYNATEEAVRVAQASGDKACVAYALGWLYHNKAKQGTESEELLERCSSRAADSKLRCLAGGANMELARHYLMSPSHGGRRAGQHMAPTKAWKRVMEAVRDHGASSAVPAMDSPTHMTDFPYSGDALHLLGRQCLLASGVWDSFGFAPLSGLSSFAALHCFRSHMSSQDVSVAMQDIAMVALHGYGPETVSIVRKPGELAIYPKGHPCDQKPANSCVYAGSLKKLIDLKREHPNHESPEWKISVYLNLLEWAIRRGDLFHARSLSNMLQSCLHPRIPNYREVVVEVHGQHALLLSREGSWEQAHHLTKVLCGMCKDWGLRTLHAKFLIQLAVVRFEASPHNHISALSPLLECLAICEEFSMDSLHATALSLLGKVHLELANVKRAVSLLKAALPVLLRGAHIWFQGEALLTLAKCDLYSAKQCQRVQDERKMHKYLRSGSRYLERSCGAFERCQDVVRLREILYLQARVPNGNVKKRNDSSKRFQQACRHLSNANSPVWPDALKSIECVSGLEQLASRGLPL